MLGSLKKKLNNAIQESARITETLQQHLQRNSSTNTPESTPSSSESALNFMTKSESFLANEINVQRDGSCEPGHNLIAKYELDWKQIHTANEENALEAEIVAKQIERIETRLASQRTFLTNLINGLSEIPTLVEKLRETTAVLKDIELLNEETEKRFEELEDLCEECDLQHYMLQKQCDLSAHKQKKMAELELYRQKVAAEHQRKIEQYEQSLRQIQRERQAVFDDAFRSDLEEFKQKGAISKIQKQDSKEVALEEVVLEDTETKDALEEFLNG